MKREGGFLASGEIICTVQFRLQTVFRSEAAWKQAHGSLWINQLLFSTSFINPAYLSLPFTPRAVKNIPVSTFREENARFRLGLGMCQEEWRKKHQPSL